MDKFVILQNIHRYRAMLSSPGADDAARGRIANLLAEEEAKLAQFGRSPEQKPAPSGRP